MKTDTLIDMLARGAGPAPRAAAARRLAPAMLLGLAASAALGLAVAEPLPGWMYASPLLWLKLAYAGALACAAGWLTARLSRPVARLALPRLAVLGLVAAMLVSAAVALLLTPAGQRRQALMGATWWACPAGVLGLSLPALAGALWAVRGLAPTRPQSAGFAAGLLAGAVGAVGFALFCDELSLPYIGIWYTLGIGLAGVCGALLGPRVLRW